MNQKSKGIAYRESVSKPTVNVTVNKNRVKVFTDNDQLTSYVTNGTEFELEFYNPTTTKVLVKIKLNGKYISNAGIVLRPAERVYLDRYLDTAKKFLFDTYLVSNTETSKKAIENNGTLEVEFYKESQLNLFPYNSITYGSSTVKRSPSFDRYDWSKYAEPIGTMSSTSSCTLDSLGGTFTTSSLFNSSPTSKLNTLATLTSTNVNTPKSKSIETGRVEQGSKSDQTFTTSNDNFEYISFHTVKVNLLPKSQQPITVKDIVNVKQFCTNCGEKGLNTHKFCGNCGTKL